jgi:hypothetical protein
LGQLPRIVARRNPLYVYNAPIATKFCCVSGREHEYLDWFLRRKTANPETFTDSDIEEYLPILKKDGGLRAGLTYYRAAALSRDKIGN